MNMNITITISGSDFADAIRDTPVFLGQIFNEIANDNNDGVFLLPSDSLREFATAIDDKGEAVLRQLVTRLDAIDATSIGEA